MCYAAIPAIISAATATIGTMASIDKANQEIKNSNYRTQIALNNAQSAKSEALRQKQLGIEEARKEKLEGIEKINSLKAKNASSGFDLESYTNNINYSDTLNNTYSNAETIEQNYNQQAQNYIDKANSYLGEAGYIQDNKPKTTTGGFILKALGESKLASNNWYETY